MKPIADTRKPYGGATRSLVIAIDVGTTFSGVSYAILEPGEIPKIHGVTRFPGQEHVAGNSKIPSVLYYNKKGEMKAAGAEAEDAATKALAEDEEWVKVELFKLRLRPRTMTLAMNGLRLGPLPPKRTPVHIFGDFLSYLYTCTTSFIRDTHANGTALLNSVIPDHIEFVLAHPNGWEGAQQAKMRRAAIYGKLIADTPEGRVRIRFVTEGEASLHACVLSGLAADVLSTPSKDGFLIADAGGGTLDISSYAIKGTNPLVIEEIAPPDCVFAGSVFVSRRAREFFEQKLKGSQYAKPESLDHITRQFDEKTKRRFRDKKEPQFVHFGSPFDKDMAYGIRNGQLRLTGAEVADLFEPSIDATFKAIKRQIDATTGGSIKSVFLVGGYAASPWLFSQLQERLKALKIVVSRPDTQTSKAVADGAIGFYCDHHVSARVSKFMYGVEFLRQLDPSDPDHVARKEKLCELPSGPKLLPDAFDCILARGVKVKESTVFSRKYCTELTSLSMLRVFEVEVWCYRGGDTVPKWIERHSEAFSTLCIVKADLSMLSDSAAPKSGKGGKTYWTIVFSVEIHFGLTEFEARIKWVQDGLTKYGPATIVFNERGHRTEEEEPDFYPEDDALTSSSSRHSDRDKRRSSSSRARTPVDGGLVDSSRRSSRIETSIPEVARAPSSRGVISTPPTPSRSAHISLDKDRDSVRDRDRERDRDSSHHRKSVSSAAPPSETRSTKSNRNSIAPSLPVPGSPAISSRSRPHTPGLEYVDAPAPSPRHISPLASPAPASPVVLLDPAPTDTPALPSARHDTPPPLAPVISRAASSASAIFGTRTPPQSMSVFGEDPKLAFGTPGMGVGLGIADLGAGVAGSAASDRPVSIFGEELGSVAGAPVSIFGEAPAQSPSELGAGGAAAASGMPGGFFDEPPPPVADPLGGWGFGGIARSIGSRVASVRGSPAISRTTSAQNTKQGGPLSPLNPSAQEQEAAPALDASAVDAAATAVAAERASPPKIDTNVPLVSIPAVSALASAAGTAPGTPVDVETPTTAGGVKKKKGKKATAAAKKAEEEEKQRQQEIELQLKLEEDNLRKEAEAKAEAEAAAKHQEEEAARAQAEADTAAAAKKAQEEEDERKKQEAAAAEEEERKRAEEEKRLKEEEEAKRKKEEEEAKKPPKKETPKQVRERKKKEEQERKEQERQEKEEKDRIAREEKAQRDKEEKERKQKEKEEREEQEKTEQEEKKKADEARIEQERIAEEERKKAQEEEDRKKAEEQRLEQERIAEEERKLKEDQERVRKEEEKLRQEEERISRELAELEKEEQEAKARQEKEEQEAKARQENERKERERVEAEKEERQRAQKEKLKRDREEKEKRDREEKARQEQQKAAAPSLGFGSLWGGKATSFTNSLFNAVAPPAPEPVENGWGFGGLKKKPSTSSISRSVTGSLSKKPSRTFDQTKSGGWGSTFGSTVDFGASNNNNPASIFGNDNNATSLFGGANPDFDNAFGLTDLKPPTSVALDGPPPPPSKDDADPWDLNASAKDKKKTDDGQASDPPQPPSPDPLQVPYKMPGETGETGGETWGMSTLDSKGKKGKKSKKGGADSWIESEQPTRTATPTQGMFEDGNGAVDATNPEAGNAEDDFGFPVKPKKKKKNKETPVPGTPAESVMVTADEGNLEDELADMLGGDDANGNGQIATADAEGEWGLPVKMKKAKKGKKGTADAGGEGGGEGEPEMAGAGAGGKKKKKKK